MTSVTDAFGGTRWRGWRVAMWGSALVLLAIPAIAMAFFPGAGFNWDETDFIAFGIMLTVACAVVEIASRISDNGAYRFASIVAVGVSFMTVWANLAVGMIGSEDSPYNLLFGGVLAVALVGAVLARFKAGGLVLVMLIAALAQAALSIIGYPSDPRGGTFSLFFTLPWLLSAALFRLSARQTAR